VVQFATRTAPCHSKPALSARNLLAAGSEKADSSRDNTALRNDKPFGDFKLTLYSRSSMLFGAHQTC
jgi:hypothetical protein